METHQHPFTAPATPAATAVVVGAGIAGLAAAWRLRRAGLRVRVREREPAAGGRMRTVDHDGFRVELGASILGRNYTGMLRLIEELGLTHQFGPSSTLCGFDRDNTVHRLCTDSRGDLLRTRLIGPRTKAAVFRALPNFLAHRRCLDWDTMDRNTYPDALSASQYARRHLTQEAIDHLCEPLFGGGIVLASPDRMAAADMLFYTAKLLVPHFNSPQGAGLLTRTLADRLDVELNTRVTAVRRRDDGFSVTWRDGGGGEHTDRADAVVVAVPAPCVPGILPELAPLDRDYLSSLPYSRALIVSLGLERPPRGKGPSPSSSPAVRTPHWSASSCTTTRSPEGWTTAAGSSPSTPGRSSPTAGGTPTTPPSPKRPSPLPPPSSRVSATPS